MTLDVAGVFRDAWRMWKRDRDLLLGVAGLFVFLPQLALLLLVPDPIAMPASGADADAIRAWFDQSIQWYSDNGAAIVAADACALFGSLTILILYLSGGERPDLRAALGRAVLLLPRYLFAALLVLIPVSFGLLLILPGIYLQGRLLLVGPALVAEQPLAAIGAVRRSVALSRGLALLMSGLACIMLFGGQVLAAPFIGLGDALDGAPRANPVVALLLGSGAAAALTFAALATILIRVALYRRLIASSRGI